MSIKRTQKPSVRRLCPIHTLKGKVEFFSVMRVETEISVIQGAISLFFELVYAIDIAKAFRHLAVVDEHKLAVHPIIDSLVSLESLVLSNLIFVMYWYSVYSAGVNIKMCPKIFPAHCRALYMPAGISHSPRALPLHNMLRISLFPYCKICRMTFLTVDFHTRACLLILKA